MRSTSIISSFNAATDGQRFASVQTVTDVKASEANGGFYAYTDEYAYSGTLYYRLVMVDKDGRSSYSNIVALAQQEARSANIFPTVVENGNLFVETGQSVSQARLEVFDNPGEARDRPKKTGPYSAGGSRWLSPEVIRCQPGYM